MISNTVIVFLRDLLPIFILYAYISAMPQKPTQKMSLVWLTAIVTGILTTLMLNSFIEVISERFDGAGIEVLYSAALAIMWLSLSTATLWPNKRHSTVISPLMLIGIVVLITLKGAEFLIYFGVFIQTSDNLPSIFVGCVIGIGICISFSLLLKFLLSETLQTGAYWLFSLLWFAFLAGQFSEIIGLLSQVDYLSLSPPLFNLSLYVNDASEYGHVLNALLGYESSPSLTFIEFYLVVLCAPIGLNTLMKNSSFHTLIEGTNNEM